MSNTVAKNAHTRRNQSKAHAAHPPILDAFQISPQINPRQQGRQPPLGQYTSTEDNPISFWVSRSLPKLAASFILSHRVMSPSGTNAKCGPDLQVCLYGKTGSDQCA